MQANPSRVGLNLAQTALTAGQQTLSDHMVDYWTQFARTGDPNQPGQPVWPRFERTSQVMQSPTPTTETNFALVHQCTFWDAASGRTLPAVPNQSASN